MVSGCSHNYYLVLITPRQIESVKRKIANIRAKLAAERKMFGGYMDSSGLRYRPLKYYIQIADYKGGLTYTRWFGKNFPEDMGFPDFLFEWTVILFMNGKLREAEKKAFKTFCGNTYLFDKFFGREIVPIEKWEGSNLATPEFTEYFTYAAGEPGLEEFSDWLETLTRSEKFMAAAEKFIEIKKKLKTEQDHSKRSQLGRQSRELLDNF